MKVQTGYGNWHRPSKARDNSCPKDKKVGNKKVFNKSGLTELKARDASCPKGKKMEHKMNLTNRCLSIW